MTANEILESVGFVAAGSTTEQVVKIPTIAAPTGARRTINGRARYALPGSRIRATTGPRTTNIYEFTERGLCTMLLMMHTKEFTLEALLEALARENVPCHACGNDVHSGKCRVRTCRACGTDVGSACSLHPHAGVYEHEAP